MASLAEAELWTGLEKGGISALALIPKGFHVYLDSGARDYDRIAMSAGQRGIQVFLNPDDFVELTGARVAAITQE